MEFTNKTAQTMFDAVEKYFTDKQTYESELNQFRQDYRGDKLNEESARVEGLMQANKAKTLKVIQQESENLLANIKPQETKLDATAITPDFDLLKLPTTLTSDELLTLHERNRDNNLFLRALQEYVGSRDMKVSFSNDGIEEKRQAVYSLNNLLNQIVRENNSTVLSIAEKSGALAEYDAILDGQMSKAAQDESNRQAAQADAKALEERLGGQIDELVKTVERTTAARYGDIL